MLYQNCGDSYLSAPLRRIAVVRPGRIGDCICALPALRAIRLARPEAEITLIALPLVAELIERFPPVDRFEPFPGWPGIAEQFFDPRRALAFLARMQERRFDLALQLYGSGVNANPFTLLLGARRTAGFVRPGAGRGPLDASVPLPEAGHEVDRALALPLRLGAPHPGRDAGLALRAPDTAAAARLLAGWPRPLVGLHAGAREDARRWPAERWLRAARGMWRPGGTLVVLGGEEERTAAAALRAGWGRSALCLAGRTTLPVLAAVVARLDLLLTTDSGPAHVAYAMGTPSVTVFATAAEAERYAPPSGPHAAVMGTEAGWERRVALAGSRLHRSSRNRRPMVRGPS